MTLYIIDELYNEASLLFLPMQENRKLSFLSLPWLNVYNGLALRLTQVCGLAEWKSTG
jgi:hypothetical protein